ncbi:MAG: YicC/YloC family endoribonuclease [Christensenellales bacterium]
MQIYSMTGYGKGVSEVDRQKVTIEIKTVNHRFLDLGIKLPKGFTFADDVIRRLIKERAVRGHFDVFVNYEDNRDNKAEVTADLGLARQYFDIAAEIAAVTGCSNNIGTAEIMRMPEVVNTQIGEQDEEVLGKMVVEATNAALDNLNKMRKKEGGLIMTDLLEKNKQLKALVDDIEDFAPDMVSEHKAKLKERIEESLQGVPIDEARLLNEVAFYSDKVCVDEEITRLKAHLIHFDQIVQEGGAVGKKLDFIVQEMNRETNTIGSKCCNVKVTDKVLALKNLIEKIREQIQNIE